jgi:hypothetical protein
LHKASQRKKTDTAQSTNLFAASPDGGVGKSGLLPI